MAIEMSLKTLATEIGAKAKAKRGGDLTFPDLWKEVDGVYLRKFGNSLPLKAEVSSIHSARNMLQHQGIVPSEPDLKQYSDYSTQFLDQVLAAVTGFGLDRLFLSGLIENGDLQQMMEVAERNVSSDPKRSMEASMKSFAWSNVLAKRQLGYFHPMLGAIDKRNKIEAAIEKPLNKTITPILDVIWDLVLGIDRVFYSRVRKVAPYPMISLGMKRVNDVDVADTSSSNYNEDNAWLCYDFTIENILRWQDKKLL